MGGIGLNNGRNVSHLFCDPPYRKGIKFCDPLYLRDMKFCDPPLMFHSDTLTKNPFSTYINI